MPVIAHLPLSVGSGEEHPRVAESDARLRVGFPGRVFLLYTPAAPPVAAALVPFTPEMPRTTRL